MKLLHFSIPCVHVLAISYSIYKILGIYGSDSPLLICVCVCVEIGIVYKPTWVSIDKMCI